MRDGEAGRQKCKLAIESDADHGERTAHLIGDNDEIVEDGEVAGHDARLPLV